MKSLLMSRTLLQNLLRGPATLMYPKEQRIFPPQIRGEIDNEIEKCIFCGICSKRCPNYAISVTKEPKEWLIDRLKCCNCNLCVEVCPKDCLHADNAYFPPVTRRSAGVYRISIPQAGEPIADSSGIEKP